jgi:hypothetical protein
MHENLVPVVFDTYKLIQVHHIPLRRKMLFNADDVVVLCANPVLNTCRGGCFEVTKFVWPLKSEGLGMPLCPFQVPQDAINAQRVLRRLPAVRIVASSSREAFQVFSHILQIVSFDPCVPDVRGPRGRRMGCGSVSCTALRAHKQRSAHLYL